MLQVLPERLLESASYKNSCPLVRHAHHFELLNNQAFPPRKRFRSIIYITEKRIANYVILRALGKIGFV